MRRTHSAAAAALLREIMGDLRVPGIVTPLRGGALFHYLAYQPALGIRRSRVLALRLYIARELGSDDLEIEAAPEGDLLEFHFSEQRAPAR